MYLLTLNLFSVFLYVLLYPIITETACRDSYMTFCDDLVDLRSNNVVTWTELVVGTIENTQRKTIDYSYLLPERFRNLLSLIIINQLEDIESFTFKLSPDTSQLEYLQLYKNKIKRIKYNTFDTVNLRKLSVTHNNLEYIHKGAFHNCRIKTIDFSHNKLESIEENVFSDKNLNNSTKEIILRHNKLEVLGPRSFPSSLEILNVDHNNLGVLGATAFMHLVNLKEWTISHNRLGSLQPVIYLKAVEVIDASHNSIGVVIGRDFNNLTRLRVLDLSHNQLKNPGFFESFYGPKKSPPLKISLAFNKFTRLLIDDNNFRDHIVFLYGNPWNCKCWQVLEKFMVDNKVKRNECDLKFFATGEVPYCMEFVQQDCRADAYAKNPNITIDDLNQFSNIVMNSLSKVDCSLSPSKY